METEGSGQARDNEPPEVLRKQGRRCFCVEDQLILCDRVYPKVAFLFCLPFDSECRGRPLQGYWPYRAKDERFQQAADFAPARRNRIQDKACKRIK